MAKTLHIQGHRGARGLRPENTLPSFEAAFDAGATSVETDILLNADGVPVIYHDAFLSEHCCRLVPGREAPPPASRPLVRHLSSTQWRAYIADRNPDRLRFPDQRPIVGPLSGAFTKSRRWRPFGLITLEDLFEFAEFYEKRRKRTPIHFDLEIKRFPFRPEVLDDPVLDAKGGRLEREVVRLVTDRGLVSRTTIRSFEHRSVAAVGKLEPRLTRAVLVAGTRPVDPVRIAKAARATVYCPDVNFLDQAQVQQVHDAGIEVWPWTVNFSSDWRTLMEWGVDGITTDYPDRLVADAKEQGAVPPP
jgi:glycerophosphoryl diester phosphodiesterase